MRGVGILVALGLGACGGAPYGGQRPAPPEARCPADQAPVDGGCQPLSADRDSLERGASELADFRAEEAAEHLERARERGPYRYRDYTRVFEQLGVAYAYLGLEEKALRAFDMLLALAPGHALPYTLSPRATFVFERARKAAGDRPPPRVRVTWPRELEVDEPVPVEVEVESDPKAFLRRARLYARRRGEEPYRHYEVELEPAGRYRRLVLPPVAPGATSDQALEIHLTGYDERGNEVLKWRSAERPAEIPLDHRPPEAWYSKWWVWAVGVGVAGAAAGAAVFAITREPPDEVGGGVTLR